MLAAGSNFTVRPAHRWRLPLLALVLIVGAFLPAAAPAAVAGRPVPPPPAGPDPPRVPALWMPVAGAVVRGFDARAGPYGPGHRGVDIAAPVGEVVRAPAAGKVVFAGPVAGTTWVSLLVAPGVVVTLGPLLDPVTAGRVRPRSPVGRVGPGHQPGSGGPGGATLHLGVRVDGVYVDPLAYLVDRPRARLAPLATPGGLPGR
jgi:murein DD-endopeptidase MepM/ murein hydrolase activator NlpD